MAGLRLVLLPGLGADERLFEPQRRAGLVFQVPRMPVPEPGEDMAAYSRRVRDRLELKGPCIVGGASFGGMVACEMASISGICAVILIGSCRNAAPLPHWYGLVERASRVLPDTVLRGLSRMGAEVVVRRESLARRERRLAVEMCVQTPVTVLRRGAAMALRWTNPTPVPCPVYHIHGNRDRVIPLDGVRPDVVVPGGGHLISLTHPQVVNGFIAECLTHCARPDPRRGVAGQGQTTGQDLHWKNTMGRMPYRPIE